VATLPPTQENWTEGFLDSLSGYRQYSYYLIFSYLYYEWDLTPIPDTLYDRLCNVLLSKWRRLEHPHKHLTTRDDLSAGTGFSIRYPDRVVNAAIEWLRRNDKEGYQRVMDYYARFRPA
jgi:hypothetical protein